MKHIATTILQTVKKPFNWFRKTRKRNKVIAIIGILIIAFLVRRQFFSSSTEPQYITQEVQRKNIVQIVSETGNIETAGRVDVYSSSTGIIEEIYVGDNSYVEIDQELFKIRSTATDQEKAAAYASYMSAVSSKNTTVQNKPLYQSQLETARKAVIDASQAVTNMNDHRSNSRNNPATNKPYTQEEIDSINATLTSARQNFTSLEQKYKDADTSIGAGQASVASTWLAYQATQNLVVKAPAAGTVANLSFKVGDKVTASSGGAASVTAATSPVLTIANLGDYSVKLALNEVDVPKVAEGQSVELTLDAFPGKKFKGRVTHVDSVGTNTSGVITYNVVIVITNPERSIRPAMTANVDIIVDRATNALTVPNSAIKPYKGKKAVQVIDAETKKATYIPVEVGIKSPERTEILKGVSEGTQVIIGTKNKATNAEE